jgi:hypothetical protein
MVSVWTFHGQIPDIIPGQIDMLPIHGREMGKLLWRDNHPFLLQFLNRSCQFQRVPENDSRDHQIESLCPSLLLGIGTILNPSVPIEKHRA